MSHAWEWVLTSDQQRAVDEEAVRCGTPSETLMQSAGRNAAEWILSHRRPRSAVVLAGPGGNGGDAYVVAGMLHDAGVNVRAFAWRPLASCAPLTCKMGDDCRELGVPIDVLGDSLSSFLDGLAGADLVVDGLFGSGLSRPLRATAAAIVDAAERSGVPIVSLDVPSGLASDSGDLIGPAFHADVTVAMAFYKPCHWLYPAAAHCGHVVIVGVDYPPEVLASVAPTAKVATPAVISSLLPSRRPNGHKGTFGHVVAVVGSQGMTGAAILCARGALRAGAGRVTLALPETIAPTVQRAVPEALTIPLPDRDGRLTDPTLAERLQATVMGADALAVGPGLSRGEGTKALVRALLRISTGPCVVDADAIYALTEDSTLCASLADRGVVTPHPGEFAAWVGSDPASVDRERMSEASAYIARPGPVLLLKGRPTVIASTDGGLVINPTGNTGLATGGSGDVLTGVIAGLMAGGCRPPDAAVLGSYLHGQTADRWAAERSERSMTPMDVVALLPVLLKELER